MKHRWLTLIPLVASLALAASACDTPSAGPGAVKSAVAPRAASTSTGVILLSGNGKTETASLVIGYNGAKINIGANSLIVPRKAVDGPTEFTFTMEYQPTIRAKLTAVDVNTGAPVLAFKQNLTLTISYASTTTPIPDPKLLKVFWMQGGTVIQPMPTSVNVKGSKLSATLNHFTEYVPGVDDADAAGASSRTY